MKYVGSFYECVSWLEAKNEEHKAKAENDVLYEVKEWKRKRSLNQNSYYWVLLNRLGLVLGVGSDELHAYMLKSYGVADVFTVRDDVPLSDYFRYYDVVGEGSIEGHRYVHIRAFKGSSEMDSTEFSKLLNGVIQECQQQGIETMTPEEAARLEWVG